MREIHSSSGTYTYQLITLFVYKLVCVSLILPRTRSYETELRYNYYCFICKQYWRLQHRIVTFTTVIFNTLSLIIFHITALLLSFCILEPFTIYFPFGMIAVTQVYVKYTGYIDNPTLTISISPSMPKGSCTSNKSTRERELDFLTHTRYVPRNLSSWRIWPLGNIFKCRP